MTQDALFDYDPPRPPSPAHRPVPPARAARPKWSRLVGRLAGLPCDDCMQLHVERRDAPLARRARWRRTQVGVPTRYLCAPHRAEWRQLDGDA